jgi:MFS family permease
VNLPPSASRPVPGAEGLRAGNSPFDELDIGRPAVRRHSLRRWYTLFVLTLVYVLGVADRFVISTLIEPIRADLHLSDSSVAFLTGVSLALFYVTLGLPVAVYADRANRRNLMVAAITIWSSMTALCGLTQTYWQLAFARFGVGIGEAGGAAPANSIISDEFPWQERAVAFTIFAAGSSFGSMFGSAGGYFSDAFGWRSVFFLFGIPGLLIALLMRLTIREPARGGLDVERRPQFIRFWEMLMRFWTQPALRMALIGIFFFALWGYGLMWWTPAFLVRSHGLSVGGAGGTLVPIHGVGGTSALVLTSWAMTRLGKRDPRQYAWFIAGMIALATIPSIIAFAANSLAVCKVMLWIFIPLVYSCVGPFYALVQNLVPASGRAKAAAIVFFVANISNLIVAPMGAGMLSDLLAPAYGKESLRLALLPIACTGVLAAISFALAARTVVAEMRSAGTLGPALD